MGGMTASRSAENGLRPIITFDWVRGMFTVHALDGDSSLVPSSRMASRIAGCGTAGRRFAGIGLYIRHGGQPISGTVDYDPDTLSLSVEVGALNVDGDLTIHVAGGLSIAPSPIRQDAFDILADAKMHYFTKERAWQSVPARGGHTRARHLHTLEMPPGDYGEPRWFSRICRKGVIEGVVRGVAARLNGRGLKPIQICPDAQECGGEQESR